MTNSDIAIIFLTALVLCMIFVYSVKFFSFFRILAYYSPFNFVRIFFFKCGRVNIGKNVFIAPNVSIMDGVTVGDDSFLNRYAFIGKKVSIGNSVILARHSYVSNCEIGNHCKINTGAVIFGTDSNSLILGENCTIGYYSILDGSGGLKIGNSVHIASPSVGIWTHNSIGNALGSIKINTSKYKDNLKFSSVSIRDNVWIGGNTTVYPDSKINKNCVILPNSVVNCITESGFVYGGTPVKKIKKTKEIVL